MIIKRLTLHNFGVYAGTHTYEFSNKRPIVLIGGKNGRGKTTFLEAILLALYGANSAAYRESEYKTYGQYLRSFVSKGSLSKQSYIEMVFENTEFEQDTYLVYREWDALSKRTKETIKVEQNGKYSEFLTNNWPMFVESVLPSALSSFFFFDGEKIADLATDDTSEQMKQSIRAMLGITVLDVLKSDILRNARTIAKSLKGPVESSEVDNLRKERDELQNRLDELDKRIATTNDSIHQVQSNVENLHEQYKAKGGAAIEQRQELILQRSEKQAELEKINADLMDAAASEMPIILVKDLVSKIKLQAEDEHNDAIIRQAIDSLKVLLEEYRDVHEEDLEVNRRFIDYIESRNNNDSVEIYRLSDQALFQANLLIESGLNTIKKQVKAILKKKEEIVNELDSIDSYLSLDINENELNIIYRKIKEEEASLVEKKVQLAALQNERGTVNYELIQKGATFNKCVEQYLQNVELQDETDRKLKYSNIAVHIVEQFTVELQKRKTDTLGKTITNCYKKLANKKNLINRIEMDPESLDIRYYDSEGIRVESASLSAGEKQLMVISILWALALCSKKKLPVIIDTPLSRMDSQHRAALISTYFPNASEQTIILSTDSEIDRFYYEMMKENVGDEFTLDYDEGTKSTNILKGYFINDN